MDYALLLATAIIFNTFCCKLYYGATTAQPAVGTATGVTQALGRTEARRRWQQATHYIVRILRIRRRWAATGLHLQQPRIRDLVHGLERRRGTLRRTSRAAINDA